MKTVIPKYRNLLLALTLTVLVIAIDRITEQAVSLYLLGKGGSVAITPFFNLVWIGNDGVSFGMLQGLPYGKWLLSAFSLITTGFIFIWLWRTKSPWTACALGLIIGGALGNTFERLVYSHVIDILDFHAYGYHWPAFNLTDSAIIVGVVLLVFREFLKPPEPKDLKE